VLENTEVRRGWKPGALKAFLLWSGVIWAGPAVHRTIYKIESKRRTNSRTYKPGQAANKIVLTFTHEWWWCMGRRHWRSSRVGSGGPRWRSTPYCPSFLPHRTGNSLCLHTVRFHRRAGCGADGAQGHQDNVRGGDKTDEARATRNASTKQPGKAKATKDPKLQSCAPPQFQERGRETKGASDAEEGRNRELTVDREPPPRSGKPLTSTRMDG